MAQPDARRHMQTAFIWPAMMLALVHAHERRAVDLATATQVHDAGNTAHFSDSLGLAPAAMKSVSATPAPLVDAQPTRTALRSRPPFGRGCSAPPRSRARPRRGAGPVPDRSGSPALRR